MGHMGLSLMGLNIYSNTLEHRCSAKGVFLLELEEGKEDDLGDTS
jgi:hypothetical protein